MNRRGFIASLTASVVGLFTKGLSASSASLTKREAEWEAPFELLEKQGLKVVTTKDIWHLTPTGLIVFDTNGRGFDHTNLIIYVRQLPRTGGWPACKAQMELMKHLGCQNHGKPYKIRRFFPFGSRKWIDQLVVEQEKRNKEERKRKEEETRVINFSGPLTQEEKIAIEKIVRESAASMCDFLKPTEKEITIHLANLYSHLEYSGWVSICFNYPREWFIRHRTGEIPLDLTPIKIASYVRWAECLQARHRIAYPVNYER